MYHDFQTNYTRLPGPRCHDLLILLLYPHLVSGPGHPHLVDLLLLKDTTFDQARQKPCGQLLQWSSLLQFLLLGLQRHQIVGRLVVDQAEELLTSWRRVRGKNGGQTLCFDVQ